MFRNSNFNSTSVFVGCLLMLGTASSHSQASSEETSARLLNSVALVVEATPEKVVLNCGTTGGKSAREPASSAKIVLSFHKANDERLHRLEAELSGANISQVRTLTVLEAGDSQFEVEGHVWKSLSSKNAFRVDAEGRNNSFALSDSKTRNGASAKEVQSVAALLKSCCARAACREQLSQRP